MKPLNENTVFTGENIYLRPITFQDIDMVLAWRNSEFVKENFFYRYDITKEEQIVWIRDKVGTGQVFHFVVCLKENDLPVGCVFLHRFDFAENSMESGVFMSEDSPKGKGIATEAIALMNREVAFGYLKLSKTIAKVMSSNIASLRLHEKVGFTRTGTVSEKVVPDGIWKETVTYELLPEKLK